MRALALAMLAACGGNTGTITIELITAPGSTVLDTVEVLQLTVTEPHEVFTAMRSDGGFSLSIDVPASGTNGAVVVEGFDAANTVVATGKSPPFPVAAIDARIVIYMAAPMSLAAAPVTISPRSRFAIGTLPYGLIFAGGHDATAASAVVEVYNAYDHSLLVGMPLPAARIQPALAVVGTAVFLFGGDDGIDPTGTTTTIWRFDTTIAPAGAYSDLANPSNLASGPEIALEIDTGHVAITGTPPLVFSTLDGSLNPLEGTLTLPPTGITALPSDQIPTPVFVGQGAGSTGLLQLRGGAFTEIPGAPLRLGAGITQIANGQVLVLGGNEAGTATADAIVVTPGTNPTATVMPGILATPRNSPAVAATSSFVIAAGGTAMDGHVLADAELFDSTTLARVATIPMVVPRTGATAIALPDDQILIAGGTDINGAPIATIELFTPPPPVE